MPFYNDDMDLSLTPEQRRAMLRAFGRLPPEDVAAPAANVPLPQLGLPNQQPNFNQQDGPPIPQLGLPAPNNPMPLPEIRQDNRMGLPIPTNAGPINPGPITPSLPAMPTPAFSPGTVRQGGPPPGMAQARGVSPPSPTTLQINNAGTVQNYGQNGRPTASPGGFVPIGPRGDGVGPLMSPTIPRYLPGQSRPTSPLSEYSDASRLPAGMVPGSVHGENPIPLGTAPTGQVSSAGFSPLDFVQSMMNQAGQNMGGLSQDQAAASRLETMRAGYANLLPSFMQHQLGMGELGLRGAEALGVGGVPGTIQNRAQEAASRFSPAGIQQQFNQEMLKLLTTRTDLSPETITEVRRLLGIGEPNAGNLPNYQGGNARSGQPAPTPVQEGNASAAPMNPLGPLTPVEQRTRQAFINATRAFRPEILPPNASGRPHEQRLPQAASANSSDYDRAITTYFSSFSDPELQGNYNAIMQDAANRFTPTEIRRWWNETQIPTGPLSDWRTQRDSGFAQRVGQAQRIRTISRRNTPVSTYRMGLPSSQGILNNLLPSSQYFEGAFPMTTSGSGG